MAVHEAHVAAEVAAGDTKAAFNVRVIPSVAYTDPEVAWVGVTEDEAEAQGIKYKKGLFPWNASGRAIGNGHDEGFTKLLFSEETHAVIGGGIVGTHAGDMIGEVALAIEMGADGVDIGKTIHPHPTLGETIRLTAEAYESARIDLPLVKKWLCLGSSPKRHDATGKVRRCRQRWSSASCRARSTSTSPVHGSAATA